MIIIVIHEQPGQLTGSDCCGKIDGKYTNFKLEPLFTHTRKSLEKTEMFLSRIRAKVKNVEIHRVDSRNVIGIWSIFWKYRKMMKISFPEKIKLFLLLFKTPCLIINGKYVDLQHPGVEKQIDQILSSTLVDN